MLTPQASTARHQRDVATGRSELVAETAEGLRLLERGDLRYEVWEQDHYAITEGAPLSALAECRRRIRIERGAWRTWVETHSTLSADAAQFHVTNSLEAYEGDVRVCAKTWSLSVPRDLV